VETVQGTPDVSGPPVPLVHTSELAVPQARLAPRHFHPAKRILHRNKRTRNLVSVYLLVLLYFLLSLTLFLNVLRLLHFLLPNTLLHLLPFNHLLSLHLLKTILQMSWFTFYHQFLFYYYLFHSFINYFISSIIIYYIYYIFIISILINNNCEFLIFIIFFL
jgi:hypothetical protein